jgi:hypothetical protein
MFDLHFHSDASDGEADFTTVCTVVAAHPEIAALALTDHDAIAASIALAARDARAWVGAELTAYTGEVRIDILGLNLRPDHDELNAYLSARVASRRARFLLLGDLLRAGGWAFDPDEATLSAPQLGQPHVARELRRQSANHARLRQAGLSCDEASARAQNDGHDAIYDVLLRPLMPQIRRQTEEDVATSAAMIGLVHRAGGLAFVAHPWIEPYDFGRRDRTVARAMIAALAAAGLDGLERWHPDQVEGAVGRELARACRTHGLLSSAGSDDHRADLAAFGTALPAGIDGRPYLARLREAAQARRSITG